jgi:hypothetical protein
MHYENCNSSCGYCYYFYSFSRIVTWNAGILEASESLELDNRTQEKSIQMFWDYSSKDDSQNVTRLLNYFWVILTWLSRKVRSLDKCLTYSKLYRGGKNFYTKILMHFSTFKKESKGVILVLFQRDFLSRFDNHLISLMNILIRVTL